MKRSWELVADKLSKAGWSLGWVSAVDSDGERSGSLMHTAIMESRSLRGDEKLTTFIELESAIRGSLFASLANLSRKLVAKVFIRYR